MRIAYYSIDEVNRALVQRWGGRAGIQVTCPVLPACEVTADAVVLDLDFLPEPHRSAWLSAILTRDLCVPVLVHGHGISEVELAGLRRRRVNVCPGRLRREFFQCWARRLDAVGAQKAHV
ncbi:MAG TPA: hypothetical protein VKD90_15940 [Gemmataceae bacterium]|nr:hypothetical protein [Gemmataceae bacterium]